MLVSDHRDERAVHAHSIMSNSSRETKSSNLESPSPQRKLFGLGKCMRGSPNPD